MNNACIWDEIWKQKKDNKDFLWWVKRETEGVRAGKIFSYVRKYLGSISGIKTIEVGCGSGVYSFIFTKLGALATLMDLSQDATLYARNNFESAGMHASFLNADAFSLSPDLLGKFDLAMSFGTIEHFKYPLRFLIAKAHIDLVKSGGLVIIGVPNRMFLPHEILKFYLQKRGKWRLGYEGAFMRKELFQLGHKLGLKNTKISGSAFIMDMFRYFRIIQGTNFFRKFCRISPSYHFSRDVASPFDDLIGADIVLMGCK